MSADRERAGRLAELVDSVVVPRKYENRAAEFPSNDGELRELWHLAQALAEVTIEPPDGFDRDLARRLPALAEQSWLASQLVRISVGFRALRDNMRIGIVRAWSPALSALAMVGAIVLLLRGVVAVPVVSASEILSRSDAALTALVKPGQLLYRRWRVTSMTTDPGSVQRDGRVRTVREWMDGADFERVAGRWSAADDRLLIGYTSVASGGERRPQVYFSPGVFGEARGLVSMEPTADEFAEAVREFPDPVRGQLGAYLRRQSLYLPIAGEQAFNRAVIDAARRGDADPARIVLSFDRAEMNGEPVYRVRVVDPAWIDFNWRSDGPPRVRLALAEIARYIAAGSYLSVRSEEILTFEDGRRRVTSRELVETRAVRKANLSLDPFSLEIPEGTPVQRQSAREQLSGVARVFARLSRTTH